MKTINELTSERRNFILIKGGIVWAANQEERSEYWIRREYPHLHPYAYITHGCIRKDGVVQIYSGFDYSCADMNHVSEKVLKELVKSACEYSGKEVARVYNGLNVGEVGVVWSPIEDLGEFKPE